MVSESLDGITLYEGELTFYDVGLVKISQLSSSYCLMSCVLSSTWFLCQYQKPPFDCIINCKSMKFCQLHASKDSMKFTGHDRKSVSNADDQPARKWKSMFDVSGGKSGSPSVNTVNSPLSPTKPQRSKTPTFSVFTRAMNNTGGGVHRRTSSPSATHYGIALPL